MSEVLHVARKEVLRRRKDPFAIAVWLLIPLSLAAIFALIFGNLSGGGGMPRATLLVADNDGSFVSGLVSSALGNSQLESVIEPEVVEEAVGRDMMMDGKASALLIIPEGFGEAYLNGDPTTLELVRNPMQNILPTICESVVETLIDMGFIARSVLDEPIQAITGVVESGVEPPQNMMDAMSIDIGRTMQRAQPYFFPIIVSLEVESIEEEKEQEEFNFAAAYYPGLMLMAILFISVGLSQDVWREKRNGTLSRCIRSPASLFSFFVGKLAGALVICALVLAVMLAAGPLLFDMTWHHLWAVILLGLATSALLLAAFSVLVLALSRNERTSNVVTDILMMALMLTSGTAVPLETLPESMVKLASFTPIGHVLIIYKEMAQGGLPLGAVFVTLAAYVGIAALLGVVAGRGLFPSFANR
jgi:ABC-2 type transport system permease protein